jgi:ABC-type Fe3+ transport system substrate-binding protein
MRNTFIKILIILMALGILLPMSTGLATSSSLDSISSPAVTDTLVILHPHSADFAAYVISDFKSWYKTETGNDIIVTTKEHDSGTCYTLVDTWAGTPEADVWWGGGEYNFEQARQKSLLYGYNVTEDGNITADLGGWHLKDDSATAIASKAPAWYAAAISGFGIMYNKEYLDAEDLPYPHTWDDLVNPMYFDHIVMANPDLSGSTIATVKQVLMEKNDQTDAAAITEDADMSEGWAYWAKVTGNIGEFTTSSSKVPAMVYDGTYGVGICIDYYAYDKMALSDAIGFTYGGATTVSPDPAGIIDGADNLDQAKAFMDYLTGTRGQVKVGKYRTPANIKAIPESQRIPRAWDDAGNMNDEFPTITPFNVSLDGAIYRKSEKLFNYWLCENLEAARQSWQAISASTDTTARANAVALHTKLPSDFSGTIASLLTLDDYNTTVLENWKTEGAANFAAAKTEAGKDYGTPIETGTTTTTEEEGQIPGFGILAALASIGILISYRRRKK